MRKETLPQDQAIIFRKFTSENPAFQFEIAHINNVVKTMPLFHWHNYLEISYVEYGKGTYYIEDKIIPVTQGDIVIINHIERHRVVPQEGMRETVFHFGRDLLTYHSKDNLFDYETTLFHNKLNLEPGSRETVLNCMQNMIKEYRHKQPYYDLFIVSELYKIIGEIRRQKNIHNIPLLQSKQKSYDIMRLDQIQMYIAAHIQEDVSLREVARHFFLSAPYFSEYFKKNLGIIFTAYKNILRINNIVEKMKEDPSRSVLETAFSCGFNSESHFYEVFNRMKGVSPKQYFSGGKGGQENPVKQRK